MQATSSRFGGSSVRGLFRPSGALSRWCLSAAACGALLATTSAQTTAFEGRLHIAKPHLNTYVRFVDIDGDGRRDMIRGGDDGGQSYVYVSLQVGNSAFRTVYSFFTLAQIVPSAFATGDIDGDGDRDVVYAHLFDSVSILRNVGSGSFLEVPDVTVGAVTYAIELADVDGDSDLDLLVAGYEGQLRVMLNSGNGTFVAGPTALLGAKPIGMAVADVDADGIVDVMTADFQDGTVSVLIGLGNGTFAPRVIHAVGSQPSELFVADVDGDADGDLIVAVRGTASVSVLANLGGGSFGPATSYTTGPGCGFIDVADLNADGAPDVAVSNLAGSVSILMNTGSGAFAPPVLQGNGNYGKIGALDLDQDGDFDLALDGGFSLMNDGHGSFSESAHEALPFVIAPRIETGDLDGDGDADVVVQRYNAVTTLMNQGMGVLGPPISTPHPTIQPTNDLRLADVDGDGDLDAVVTESPFASVYVRMNMGNGVMGSPIVLATGTSFATVAVVDMNGDGRPEILGPGSGVFVAASNMGGGSFAPFATISPMIGPAVGWLTAWTAADYDGDGDVDVILAGTTNIRWLDNDGTGMLAAPAVLTSIPWAHALVAKDLDGDGETDLVISTDAGISVVRNLGGGAFAAPVLLGPDSGELSILDFDQDGDPDILCVAASLAVVFENVGTAVFSLPTPFGAGGAVDLAPLDLDGDGDVDLVGCGHDRLFTLENRTTSGFGYCFGDGSATACPCGNASLPAAHAGCTNSGGRGGALRATGSTSLVSDSLVLRGSGMTSSAVLYFQGTMATNGGSGVVFGDGLRCVGGTLVRLDLAQNVLGASVSPGAGDPSLRALGHVTTPGVRHYQAWYRDAQAFCTGDTFNLTNGLRIVWRP